MALRDGTTISSFPVVPPSLLGIGAAALAGIAIPLAGVTSNIGGMGWAVLGMLALVSLVALLQTRFLVLPSMRKAFLEQRQPATLAELERSVGVIVLAFSIAPATYGVIGGVISGAWWPALPFGAMALVTLAVTHGYAQQQLDALRGEARARGER
ncbi:MAG TPA: hypothetical protein VJP07_05695 [Dehalococcoidia bacterium]|nr:hypothetical protein [Dehalococcoidia bacterium]